MRYWFVIILGLMLAGCSSNSLVSSFSSRKYTKGIFKDALGDKPAVVSRQGSTHIAKNAIDDKPSQPPLITSGNVLAKEHVKAIGGKQVHNTLNQAIVHKTTKSVKRTPIAESIAMVSHVRDEVVDGEASLVGKILMGIGIAIILLSAIIIVHGISPWVALLVGIGLTFFGFLDYLSSLKSQQSDGTDNKPTEGSYGFGAVIGGISTEVIFALLLNGLAGVSGVATWVVVVGIIGIIFSLTLLIGGMAMCGKAIRDKDKNKGLATVGLILGILFSVIWILYLTKTI